MILGNPEEVFENAPPTELQFGGRAARGGESAKNDLEWGVIGLNFGRGKSTMTN